MSCVSGFVQVHEGNGQGAKRPGTGLAQARTFDGKLPKTEKIGTRRMIIGVEGAALAAEKRISWQGGWVVESRRPELHARNAGDQGTMKGSMGHPDRPLTSCRDDIRRLQQPSGGLLAMHERHDGRSAMLEWERLPAAMLRVDDQGSGHLHGSDLSFFRPSSTTSVPFLRQRQPRTGKPSSRQTV